MASHYPQYIPLASLNNLTEYNTAYKATYTDVTVAEVTPHRQQTFKQKYFGGITRTLRFFLALSCLILVINVIWLVIARTKYGIQDGLGTITKDYCSIVKSTNTWLHLGINLMSTLLLTGSNAFMAAYSCPSRPEVDEAHRRGKSVHVGTLGLGNLRRISLQKGLMVILLGLSSVPFHLLYNALVFEDLAINNYYWSVVTEDFLTGAPFNLTGDWTHYSSGAVYIDFTATPPDTSFGDLYGLDTTGYLNLIEVMNDYFHDMQQTAPSWQRLENKDCIDAYSNVFLADRRNLILVSSEKNDTNSIIVYGSADIDSFSDYTENWWICSEYGNDGGAMTCNPDTYTASLGNWTVFGHPIEYCLSQEVQDVCSLQFSQTIMYVVIAFNTLKVFVMMWILWRYDAERILTSVGDAVSSFLQHEDFTTSQMCLANKRQMRDFWQSRGFARPYNANAPSWGDAVSRKRWVLFFLLMTLSFAFVLFFGTWGFSHVKSRGVSLDAASLWRMGFGAVNQNTLTLADKGPNAVVMAIVANIPQIFLSVIYVMFMGIMTSMFLAADWSMFAFKPQTIMVSTPVGRQRGTWLLGAPLGWGLALLTLQLLLHWFVSQSLFMVQVTIYDKDGKPWVWTDHSQSDFSKISNAGYSPIAIICAMATAVVLLLLAIIFCWRSFPANSPPVVSTCSAAISAACHPMHRYEEMRFGDLRWGVDGSFPNGVGHCSLMGAEKWDRGLASAPLYGYTYAGIPTI